MKTAAILLTGYALAIFLGGMVGYYQAGSLISLMAGSLSSTALLACAYAAFKQKTPALYIALGITFLLDGIFTKRFIKTGLFFPSGLMIILSLGMLVALTWQIRKIKAKNT